MAASYTSYTLRLIRPISGGAAACISDHRCAGRSSHKASGVGSTRFRFPESLPRPDYLAGPQIPNEIGFCGLEPSIVGKTQSLRVSGARALADTRAGGRKVLRARVLADEARDVHVQFNNNARDYAPKAARKTLQTLGQAAG
jgi:hypothetical protein